jgi:hypothetical protein
MLIEELVINRPTKKFLLECGFKSVEELVDGYKQMGNTAIVKNLSIPPLSDPNYKTIIKLRADKIAVFKQRVLPIFFERGYLEKLPSKKEKEDELNCKLIGANEVATLLGIHNSHVSKAIKTRKIPCDVVFKAKKDILVSNSNQKYLFRLDRIQELAERYSYSLEDISREVNIEANELTKILSLKLSSDEYENVRFSGYHWNGKWVIENIQSILSRNTRSPEQRGYMDLIGEKLQKLVDDYIQYRIVNEVIEFDGKAYFSQKMISKKIRIHDIRVLLLRYLYKIKCSRVGIVSAASFIVGSTANGIDVSSHGWSPTSPLAVYGLPILMSEIDGDYISLIAR